MINKYQDIIDDIRRGLQNAPTVRWLDFELETHVLKKLYTEEEAHQVLGIDFTQHMSRLKAIQLVYISQEDLLGIMPYHDNYDDCYILPKEGINQHYPKEKQDLLTPNGIEKDLKKDKNFIL